MPDLFWAFAVPAEKIFSRPVYYYLYPLFGIIFLAAAIYFKNLKKALSLLILIVLFTWSGLALKSSGKDFIVFSNHYRTFGGRSTAEKNALLIGHDYCNYLEWCKNTLGEKKEVALIVPDNLPHVPAVLLKLWGPYYLVPHFVKWPADYLLVYKAGRPKGNFEEFARYSPDAYILRKK